VGEKMGRVGLGVLGLLAGVRIAAAAWPSR